MFELYTERARRVIFFARYHASEFGMMTIESEHLLLGLIREDKYLADHFLQNQGGRASIRADVEKRVSVREKVSTWIDLPLSDECKRILAYARDEMERMRQSHLNTEHLLLGILREEKCIAAEILSQRGLNLDDIRSELVRSPIAEPRPTISVGETSSSSLADEFHFSLSAGPHPVPESGVVPDAETAKLIAEAVWKALYGAEATAAQLPFQAELRHNVWIVAGSSAAGRMFAFVLQRDGRILSIGRQ